MIDSVLEAAQIRDPGDDELARSELLSWTETVFALVGVYPGNSPTKRHCLLNVLIIR